MKRILLLFPVVLVLWTLFQQCAPRNEVRVAGTNFDQEISRSQNLVFTFNKNLVNGADDNWDSTQYIRFEPAVKGRFRWTAPNELVFSPIAGFDAAAQYKATLTPHLLKNVEDKNLRVSGEAKEFHTPYLNIIETESWWTISRNSNRHEARLRLRFNYGVNKTELAQLLKVRDGEREVRFEVLPSPEESIATLSLSDAGKTGHEASPLKIEIAKGLKAAGTSYTTTDPISVTASLPSPLHLEVIDIQTGFENNAAYTRVVTSQELRPESIVPGFSVSPDIQAKAEPTENGFKITGNFNETETYALLLNNNLQGLLGPTLQEAVSKDLFFGKMPAAIAFSNKKAVYLTPKGARNVGVQIVNVPKVQVRIAKLYANNILAYVKNNRWEEYAQVGEEWKPSGAFQYGDDSESNFSDLLVDKTVETANLPRNKGISALNIAIPDDQARKGVYLVSINSKDEAYLGATKLVSVSDIGIIVKHGKDDVWVFANSIKTSDALANVEISLVSSNNQQLATAKTNSEGIAHVSKLSEKAPGFRVAMVTATSDNDFNYLLLDDTRVETSRFEVDGLRNNTTGLQAFLYGEREIYRPGETMHFNVVVRNQNWKSPGVVPVKMRLVTPNGREFRTWRKQTNKQGAADQDVALDAGVLTGTYVMEVYNANDVLISSLPVSVEEFMPDRIKVDLSNGRPRYFSGETAVLTATATNLFGPPAANRTAQMELQLKRKVFTAAAYPEFIFDIPAQTTLVNEQSQSTTDANGQSTQRFAFSPELKDIGVLEGKIFVTVFDENGRPVNRLHRFDVLTQSSFFGIRLPDTYVGTNVPLPVELVSVNADGKPVKSQAKVEVVRLEYQTVVEKQNGQLRYASRKQEKIVYTHVLNLAGGKGTFQYTPTVSGEYEVRVRRPDAMHHTAVHFYAYGYGNTQYSSFEVSNEGRVLMETDQPKYKPGETASVLFKTPFDGRLLVTVERNDVTEQHVLKTDKKAAELKLKLDGKSLPNVYVSATLIRPLDASDLPLTVAHGFIPVMIEDPSRSIPVHIAVAQHSRSKTKQTIHIKANAHAQVTIAVVDEGILQIKNTRTPDIHGYFYQKKALEVSSHDLYALLFPELPAGPASSFGGDGYGLEKRINPLSNGRTKLVTFWSGILETNGKGEVSFDIQVPQFSGDLRVMAVAYDGDSFGSASKNMKISDPLVISAGIPRFMSPGDVLSLPVNISNTTAKPIKTTLTVSASGPLISPPAPQSMVVPAGKEIRAMFQVKAATAIGNGKIAIKAITPGENFTEVTDITVRPASPLLKTSQSGMVAGGKQATIDMNSGMIPATTRGSIVLSRSPLVQGGGKALTALLGYPYGCLEQTISKAFPQLYFGDLAKAMAVSVPLNRSTEGDLNPVTNVQQAIRKIESLQLYNGGFTMWPGGTQDDWWATAYAVHFMDEARRAGFEINASTLTKAQDYLTGKTRNTATKEVILASTGNGLRYGSEPSSGSQVRKTVARREAIYTLYVLAMSGQPNRASMNYYKQNQALLTTDTRYLLASAFAVIGDSRSYQAMLPKTYTPENASFDDSYASPMRNLALTLNTLLETDRANPQTAILARQLSQAIASASYLNTQEAAFAVLALGKIARSTAGSTVTADLKTVAGKLLGNFTGKELSITQGIAGQKLAIETRGAGNLYWFSQLEGMSATNSVAQGDQGLSIRRAYLDAKGQPITLFKQNDLVVVKLTLKSISGLPIEHVVVTDLLPAGFEIENPRLTEQREMNWLKNPAIPEYLDVRDDRIHFFTSAGQMEKTFYYQVRVVSKGTFTAGPAAADAMYQGGYHSYAGARKIMID